GRGCGGFDLLGLRIEACLLAEDADLDRVGARVEEALEAGDEGGLLVRVSQLEARALRADQQAVAALGELEQAASEHAPDRNVERGEPWLAGAAREPAGQALGRQHLPL